MTQKHIDDLLMAANSLKTLGHYMSLASVVIENYIDLKQDHIELEKKYNTLLSDTIKHGNHMSAQVLNLIVK